MGGFLKKTIFIIILSLFFSAECFAFSDISAKSYVVMEQSTNSVIFSKNMNVRMKPASTTKILTAICAVENARLTDLVTVSKNAAYQEGSSMYLKEGDKVTLENLVYGLMLNSGNDAAVAIAEHIGGSVEKFSNIMNNKAKDIGAVNSNFENPNGLDSDEHYVTAYDLALITSYCLNNEKFSEIVATKSKVIKGNDGLNKYLSNHNKMLHTYPDCIGVKTGFTKKSGRTLVTSAKKDGIKIIVVTLNAPNDWSDHKKLLDRGFLSVEKEKIIDNTKVVDEVNIKGGTKEKVSVKCEEEFYGVKIKGNDETFDVVYKYDKLKAPVISMQKAGEALVYKNGKEIFKTNLITTEDVEKKKGFSIIEFIKRIFKL